MSKERPILFNSEMVKAVIDGRKTQTRRVIKPQPERLPVSCHYSNTGWALEGIPNKTGIKGCSCIPVKCPYGFPGDRLWVRETFATYKCLDNKPPRLTGDKSAFWYKSDDSVINLEGLKSEIKGKWRPSIHMPRWASRINLEITSIRVERVQDINKINHDDVLKEGWPFKDSNRKHGNPYNHFQALWDTINLKRGYGWDKNPWVWVVEFKVTND